jgi:hypothetical protein
MSSQGREDSRQILQDIFAKLIHPISGAMSRRILTGTLTLTVTGSEITAINVDQTAVTDSA